MIFCSLGLGYTARYVSKELLAKGFIVKGVTSNQNKLLNLEKLGIKIFDRKNIWML